MRKIYFFLAMLLAVSIVSAQTNPSPQSLPYTQNFAGFTGTAPVYPAGIQGWTITGSTSTSFPTAAASSDQAVSAATNASTGAHVGDYIGKIGLLSTGTNMKSIALSINTTSNTNIQVSYLIATQRQEATARIGAIGLQYRVGNTGTFTNVAATEYSNPGGTNNTSGTGALNPLTVNVTLPAACENQPEVQLRWVYREVSGGGNRPGFSIDDISVTGTSGGGPLLSATALTAFGNVCINTSAGPNSFIINGSNLTTANVTVSALDGFTYSVSSSGPYTTTLSISQGGGSFSQEVFVMFNPTLVQSYSDDINVEGGGAAGITVSAAGSGVNTTATALPGEASNITGNSADVEGVILTTGCSAVTAYGIEYAPGTFSPGSGTQVAGGPLSGNTFTSQLSGLNTATTYYYRTYVTNAGGTIHSSEDSFRTQTPEPTNHATGFACGTTTASTIPLTWTDATGGTVPMGYLIKWSSVGFGSITDPVDGTPEANGAGVLNIAPGFQSATPGSLVPGTTYYFKIYPYTNSGTLIDYKIDGTVPQTSCATGSGPIAAWDFFGMNTVATATATTFDVNLVSASGANNITRGAGAAASAGANSFRTTGFQNNGISTANTDYFQVTLSAQPGFELSLSSIDGLLNGTASYAAAPGVSNQFAYSLDGANFTLIGSASVTTGQPVALPTIDLTAISALQNVSAGTTITLRYYASGQTTTGGWGFSSSAAGVNGLAIGGTLTASSTPSLTVTPTSLTFGQQAAGSSSVSQSVDLSGINLTGVPGVINILAPSTDFQVSNDNSNWGAGTTVTYNAANLAVTPVYIRFTPQSAGPKSGSVTFSGGGDLTPPTVAVSGTATISFYSKTTGDLTNLATWGTNADGTGTAPSNFTTDGQVFVVTNRPTVTLDADWTVSGTGAKIVVGNGASATDLTIASTLAITGVIDISALGELTVENSTVTHTYGTIAVNSTIEYAQAGSFTIPNNITYGNLVLTGGAKTLMGNTTTINGDLIYNGAVVLGAPGSSPFATVDLNGDYIINGAVTNPGDINAFTLVMNGGGTQVLNANDNLVRVFRLTVANNTNVELTNTVSDITAGNASGGGVEVGAGSSITVNNNTIATFASGPARINGQVGSTGTFITSTTSSFNIQSTSNSNSILYFDAVNNSLWAITTAISGTGQLVIGSNATIMNTLTVTNSKLVIAEGTTLQLQNTSVLGGVYDATRYIVTAANASTGAKGFLRINNIPAGNFTFPVGSATHYLPATVNPTAVNDFSVNAFNGITVNGEPNGTAFTATQKAKVVDAVWIVNRDAGNGDVTLTTSWPAALEGTTFSAFTDAQIGVSRNDGINWGIAEGSGDNTANTATRTAISAFSPFGVGEVGQALPVNFGNVKATQQNGSIKIDWSNLTELDVVDYTIERSNDGRNFSSIGQVNARLNNGGKADYSFIDVNPFAGTNYYRIRSLEGTGKTKYSIVVKVDLRGGATQLVLYPNPATGGQLGYQAVNLKKGQYTIRIFNAAGQQVYSQALNHAGGSVSESIVLPSSIGTGVFTLQFQGEHMQMVKAFVVQ